MSNRHRRQIAAVLVVLLWMSSPHALAASPQSPAPGAQRPASNVETSLAEARRLIDAGKAQEAIAALEAARERADDPRLDALNGVAHYHADDYRSAVTALERVRPRLVEGSDEQREVEQVLGLSLHLLGRYEEAIPWLERARTRATESLEQAQVLAVAYVQTHQPDQARRVVSRIFAVPSESATAYLLTAQLLIRLDHNEAAADMLRHAIRKDATLPRAHFLLGQLALFRGALEEAVALTEKELALNPSDALAFSQLGDAYVQQENWEAAIAALQRSIWINPYYSAPFILLGRAYMQLDRPATAEGMLRRALEHDPNNRPARYMLARVLQQLGRAEEAKRELDLMRTLPQRR